MKFINYLESIAGVEIFPFTSLFIFFTFFLAVTIYVFGTNKKYLAEVSQIPLDNNEK